MARTPVREQVLAWRPRTPGLSEAFHARFVAHAYPAHTHTTWTLFLVDEGRISYQLDGRARGSGRTAVTILPPHVVHDGRPATSDGFTKRVLYLDGDLLGERLIGSAVDRPDLADPLLHRRLVALHALLRRGEDDLEAESRLAFVMERLRLHLRDRVEAPEPGRAGEVAEQLRALLDARLVDGVTLADASGVLGVSAAHAVRCFRDTFGLPPHAYLMGRRVELARRRLLDGEPPAHVAVGVGFYDQAHFTRHFKRHVGTTPAAFARR